MTAANVRVPAADALQFSIRPAVEEDAGDLAGLMSQLDYPSTEDEVRTRLNRALAQPEYAAWVAVADRVVGFAGAWTGFSFVITETYGRVIALIVDEGARGNGVGTALVVEAERWMISRGAKSAIVNSSNRRTAAHRFYEGLGYDITGVRLIKPLNIVESPPPNERGS